MATLVRPSRRSSFSELTRLSRGAIPADQLDAQIHNLIEAIHSTQTALEELRRDDGKLKNGSVGREQLAPDVAEHIARSIAKHTEAQVVLAEQAAARMIHASREVDLRAADAETAAFSAANFLTAVNAASDLIARDAAALATSEHTVETWATDSQNWAEYSKIQASNSEANQEQSAAWAEYLAGPVVDGTQAPAYIQSTPYGHGLYYQPVEGGVAGLWSAKWWALQAFQLVGAFSFYYLGGWHDPPLPGSSNPETGRVVPDPIPPGSFYYDIDSGTVYFWDGDSWESPYALASGVTSRFVYKSTAGQTVFTGADLNSATPVVGASPSDVHLNGVKLVPLLDYTISGNSLTLTFPATVDSYLQWDLLVPPANLVPGSVNNFKVALTGAVDGVNRVYTMQYTHPVNGVQPVNVTAGAQLMVSLDGIVQEPGGDFSATGNTLTMANAPPATGHLWAVWFANATLTGTLMTAPDVKMVESYTAGSNRNDWSGELGAQITIGTTTAFSKIGVRCGTANTGNHTVKLYSSAFTALRTAVIDLTGKTVGDFVYSDVLPITLNPGTYFLMATVTAGDGQQWSNQAPVVTKPFVSDIWSAYDGPPGVYNPAAQGYMFVGVDLVVKP